jgi:hypothetical protein
MVLIQVSADVTDDCSPTTWKIVNVSSNEDANARGSGHTAPDWQICGDHSVKLRAERAGNGQGRVYSITLQATDGGGNVSAPSTVTVTVPHSRGNGNGNGGGNGNGNRNGHGKGK